MRKELVFGIIGGIGALLFIFILLGTGALFSIVRSGDFEVILTLDDASINAGEKVTIYRDLILDSYKQERSIIISSLYIDGKFKKANFNQLRSGSQTARLRLTDSFIIDEEGTHRVTIYSKNYPATYWIDGKNTATLCGVDIQVTNYPEGYIKALKTLDCNDLRPWLLSKPQGQEYAGRIVLFGPEMAYPSSSNIHVDPLYDEAEKTKQSEEFIVLKEGVETDAPDYEPEDLADVINVPIDNEEEDKSMSPVVIFGLTFGIMFILGGLFIIIFILLKKK